MANLRDNKKRVQLEIKKEESLNSLRNVVKIGKLTNKLQNKKIKKKMFNKAKKTLERPLKKIKSLGFKTVSITKEIIEDVITDVYEVPFKEFGITVERIGFKLLNHVAEFDNTEIYNREMRDERRHELRNNLRN